ncbi:hypothetical protein HDU98_004607 [Podochytrium sp. JEL0797]|nr:hypothetical protein HDU98_004607 [Podochytrium sp. JEL0797]
MSSTTGPCSKRLSNILVSMSQEINDPTTSDSIKTSPETDFPSSPNELKQPTPKRLSLAESLFTPEERKSSIVSETWSCPMREEDIFSLGFVTSTAPPMSGFLHKRKSSPQSSRASHQPWIQRYFVLTADANLFLYKSDTPSTLMATTHLPISSCSSYFSPISKMWILQVCGKGMSRDVPDTIVNRIWILSHADESVITHWFDAIHVCLESRDTIDGNHFFIPAKSSFRKLSADSIASSLPSLTDEEYSVSEGGRRNSWFEGSTPPPSSRTGVVPPPPPVPRGLGVDSDVSPVSPSPIHPARFSELSRTMGCQYRKPSIETRLRPASAVHRNSAEERELQMKVMLEAYVTAQKAVAEKCKQELMVKMAEEEMKKKRELSEEEARHTKSSPLSLNVHFASSDPTDSKPPMAHLSRCSSLTCGDSPDMFKLSAVQHRTGSCDGIFRLGMLQNAEPQLSFESKTSFTPA